jgi:RNase P subunit RPR2
MVIGQLKKLVTTSSLNYLINEVDMSRRRSKDLVRRKTRSKEAISSLSDIILSPDENSHRVRDIAARDVLRVSKKHGLSNRSISRIFVCRVCESVMRFGTDSKVRIKNKSIITTCDRCNKITRRPI